MLLKVSYMCIFNEHMGVGATSSLTLYTHGSLFSTLRRPNVPILGGQSPLLGTCPQINKSPTGTTFLKFRPQLSPLFEIGV